MLVALLPYRSSATRCIPVFFCLGYLMPRVLQPIVLTDDGAALEHNPLKRLLDDARSDFEGRVLAKRAIFGRYLETRVNWLRMQLTREAEATGSLGMNHLDFLRAFKSDSVPEASVLLSISWYREYRLVEGDGSGERTRQLPRVPPSSAMRVINTVRRVAARSRINQQANSTPYPPSMTATTVTESTMATRARSKQALNLTKATAVERSTATAGTRQGRLRRAAATAGASATLQLSSAFLYQSPIPQKSPTTSVFDRVQELVLSMSG
ncbi:hypothetical protein EGR_01909 [Echinococcus granulosus]|uniref:Uncharacterized protein n=1 Tax=Echinococcus granulosus TaxID=6210 RepID=W6UNC8_ECHGR|nr:hypothetical protein EGR_01909 [Echinococcus granulosus]EUB63105.1 hypothetical protein EGR_01909 [Echinococcus granulosus]